MLWTEAFTPLLTQVARPAAFAPPADVTIGDGDVVITMDLPGLRAEDVSIDMIDGYLRVSGERRRPEVADGASWAHGERAFGRFERRLRLPDGVDPDAITASMSDGVLSLIVPKPQRLRRRTIPIGTDADARALAEGGTRRLGTGAS
ncbi:Hsp20/alpha crystallin family protein [Miltoncostaea marina]|uniref:Hsp20/alpha crystallin family protein n=1 Tax=Miltoncostaea marina TaxID=2843215 RepID=UPI001C3E7332|nr:Hsp20/alpha crystallin family protein [Miltoncostaea marina]